MIILDTHIWLWWANGDPRLRPAYRQTILAEEKNGLGVAAISCWEVALLASYKRIQLGVPVAQWIARALVPPVLLLPLSPEIAVEAHYLPGNFHRDPADRLIVATARVYNVPLMALDGLILAYPHVRLVP